MTEPHANQTSTRRALLLASGAAVVGAVGIPFAVSMATRTEPLQAVLDDAGWEQTPFVDLRRFGAVPDGKTDLAPAINRAVAAFAGTPCTLVLPVNSPGERYLLDSDARIDHPDISLLGYGCAVEVAPHAALRIGRTERRMVANARVAGIQWVREGTDDGNSIADGSRFIVLERVRDVVITACRFVGADIAIHIPANPLSEMHDTAFVHIVGQNRFEEVNFAIKGEYDPDCPGRWLAIGDFFVTGCVINRSYVSGVHFDAIDGIEVNECDFVNLGSYSSRFNPRGKDKANNVYIGRSDWVHVTNNQLYEAGREAVRIAGVRQAKVTGNLVAWPGQIALSDAISVRGDGDFPTRVVVADNVIVWYTRSAVSFRGTFGAIAVAGNAVSYASDNDKYVGPVVDPEGAPALDSVDHFRYELADVKGVTAAEISIAGASSGRPGEEDRLPGHEYTRTASKDTTQSGSSSALRTLTLSGPRAVFPVRSIEGSTEKFGGMVLIVVRSESDADFSSEYLLMVSSHSDQCLTLGVTGSAVAAGSPAFTWRLESRSLVAAPVSGARGTYLFSAQTMGDLIVG